MRILSMLPSAPEIIHALGLIDHLVGRSHECDYPPRVLELPVVTHAYIDSQSPSHRIDQAVKERASQGLSLYGIRKRQIRKLAPDFIVTQTQCDLCAVSLSDVQTFLKNDVGVSAELLVLAPNTLNDVWRDIRNAGAFFGVSERGESVADKLAARLPAIKKKTQSLPSLAVAMIEWTEPLMAAGNWIPELVALAGGHDVFGRDDVHSASIQQAELQKPIRTSLSLPRAVLTSAAQSEKCAPSPVKKAGADSRPSQGSESMRWTETRSSTVPAPDWWRPPKFWLKFFIQNLLTLATASPLGGGGRAR